ncbi:hypothetical protein GGF50DRAFT_108875 [Schizophyllum commune]
MKLLLALVSAAISSHVALAHEGASHDQVPFDYNLFPYQMPAYRAANGEGAFSGITTFARLPWVQCLGKDAHEKFDIAFLGAPFDTGTSYRPGARFGPSGIRAGSRRLNLYGGYNVPMEVNPFTSLRMVDCGDIPVTPYDNSYAIKQIEEGHKALLKREAFSPLGNDSVTGMALEPLSRDGKSHPRVLTLGGDHTIVLPLLRSINSVYGAISVVHFDSHLDTWKPQVFGGAPSEVAAINHGTYFWHAAQEGLIKNGTSIASIFFRSPFPSPERTRPSFRIDGIVKKIRDTVGDNPVYLSIDIDSIDPAFAPGTGTPETGGWSTRELRTIIRGLDGLKIVSADVVEVAPAYDTNAELTTMAAADVSLIFLSLPHSC